ncbi:MAG: DUF2235 domain-containing protein [Rhodoplanes sp.]
MAKNILIFSDGTGQAGGLRPDQRLTNIYKLYRATRTGPDSPIDPAKQIALYDPGLGSGEQSGPFWSHPVTSIRKLLSSGFGTGFTRNVADCYEAILRFYEPGDRIYLFGFSRGAYTVRSVGGVMNLCGVPVKEAEGDPIPRHGKALRAIADEAVHTVYEHGAGHPREKFEDEREEQARRFRIKYNTEDDPLKNQRGDVVPYFIGVFDTVAALGSTGIKKAGIIALAVLGVLAGSALAGLLLSFLFGLPFLISAIFALVVFAVIIAIYSYNARVKVIRDFPEKGMVRRHWSAWRFKHYDRFLDRRVRYARHAQAIDERRASFARVGWGRKADMEDAPDDWLVQLWFPGNHSDIGGSYPETESRLSDIALQWMVEQATQIPDPVIIDTSKLNLFPDPAGMQHCEICSVLDLYPAWFPARWRRSWNEQARQDISLSLCHPTVLQRIECPAIRKLGVTQPYRPEPLRNDQALSKYYGEVSAIGPASM